MANTINDITLSDTTFTDVLVAASIPASATMDIQNKTPKAVVIQIVGLSPPDDSLNGYYLEPYQILEVVNPATGVWAKAFFNGGKIMVRRTA